MMNKTIRIEIRKPNFSQSELEHLLSKRDVKYKHSVSSTHDILEIDDLGASTIHAAIGNMLFALTEVKKEFDSVIK